CRTCSNARCGRATWARGSLRFSLGLSHIQHAPVPNWRYVAMASVAGWFYGLPRASQHHSVCSDTCSGGYTVADVLHASGPMRVLAVAECGRGVRPTPGDVGHSYEAQIVGRAYFQGLDESPRRVQARRYSRGPEHVRWRPATG